ncbi:MAG: hypothetical protein ACKOW9_00660 [Candidatus Paceibacterota bacterium]
MVNNEKHPLTSTQKYISFPDLSGREDYRDERSGRGKVWRVLLWSLVVGVVIGAAYFVLGYSGSVRSEAPGKFGVESGEVERAEGELLESGVVRYFIIDENEVVYIVEDNMSVNNYDLDSSYNKNSERGIAGCEESLEGKVSSILF